MNQLVAKVISDVFLSCSAALGTLRKSAFVIARGGHFRRQYSFLLEPYSTL